MPLYTYNPTANVSPDPGQGGSAVTSPSNTGQGSTVTSATGGGATDKSCKWTGFPAAAGQIKSINLKYDWTQTGSLNSGDTNLFRTQYSLDGGTTWTTLHNATGITSSSSGTDTQSLVVTQNLTQVQLRTLQEAVSNVLTCSVTVSISNVRIEVQVVDGGVIAMM